jgi:hypothetical protein
MVVRFGEQRYRWWDLQPVPTAQPWPCPGTQEFEGEHRGLALRAPSQEDETSLLLGFPAHVCPLAALALRGHEDW